MLDKFVGKNYNNELEKILEKKAFDENTKSNLLNVMYKIETAYKDYEKVKQNVISKEEFIENIISTIQNKCDDIKIVKMNSEEMQMLGVNHTFLIEKKKKRIICYPIDRKILYCLAKIDKPDSIIKDKYYLINNTLSELITVGNNIETVEPIRDFNGYSWTTISREIESIPHNLIYQNLRMLIGNEFITEWVNNKVYMIDYLEEFQDQIERKYGKGISKKIVQLLENTSILLAIKFNSKLKSKMKEEKEITEKKLKKIQDNKTFTEEKTIEKRKLTKEIKHIDETLNNKEMLQKEYETRNENVLIENKIFSTKILSKIMMEEREEKIERIEEINKLLTPKEFIKYKKQLEIKNKYLKLLETKDIEKEIQKNILEMQKEFLKCFEIKLEKAQTKQEIIKLMYELRYYNLLPYTEQIEISKAPELKEKINQIKYDLLKKAYETKATEKFSKKSTIHYDLLEQIFETRVMNLEDLYIKVTKEKKSKQEEKYYVQFFDENRFEEKIELQESNKIAYKDLEIRLNKKVKIFR